MNLPTFANPPDTGPEWTAPYDLSNHHAIYPKGSVSVVLTWNLKSGEPTMVLVNNEVLNGKRVVPCLIPMSRAWVWDEQRGDLDQTAFAAVMFCDHLGFTPNNRNVFRVLDMVREHLGDFLAMPPLSEERKEIVAEMTVIDNATGSAKDVEVRDHA